MSAAKSSRRSAASFARRRAARARARGVVRSCWTGSDLHVDRGLGVDAQVELGIVKDSEARVGFGVASSEAGIDVDVDAEIRVDIARAAAVAAAEGTKDAKVTPASDDISRSFRGTVSRRWIDDDDDDDDDG